MDSTDFAILTLDIIEAASNLCKELNYWHDSIELADDVIASQEKLETLLAIYEKEDEK